MSRNTKTIDGVRHVWSIMDNAWITEEEWDAIPTGPRVAAMTFEIDTPGANLTRSGDWLINRGNYYRWTGEPLTEGVFSTLSITPVGGFLVYANGTKITRTA